MAVMITPMTEISPSAARSVITQHLGSHRHSWSIGVPGAIGEFMYDDGEPVTIETENNRLAARTPRGALCVNLPADTRCVAYRVRSACNRSWLQQVAFCVPYNTAVLAVNEALTELGTDDAGMTESANREFLFDLGLGSELVRFCIRTADNDLLDALRRATGQSVFATGNSVLAAIMKCSPDRVVISAAGRLEVYGPIPANNTESPHGPHTHLLPSLLKRDKPDAFIPDGLVSALTLYPENPSFDKYGAKRKHDAEAEKAFAKLLHDFGAPAQSLGGAQSEVN